ncbi:RTA1-domain-containing protein [Westerdykella ornata]|uniref:RTA1-domain-containing protein n=1 Tax=Westerdykella ornata TaxID=318751 RepID=A0A6A6JUI4_WESOR|nr:RTA1-domain-containing protein [Westerdykella ornata]KAF2279763.1 RTA1-domain-containing protein [Westerdykella ornata]
MTAGERVQVPDSCIEVSALCPVEGTLYGYAPSIGANATFAAIFFICLIIHLILGIRYKTWTFMIALGFGCLGEGIGYIGRILLWNNPYDELGFQIQICCLIISPAFIAAGVYLTLKHIVINFGERWSRLRPSWYTRFFIGGDILSLVLQGAGGGIAATAERGSTMLDVGTNLMIAGVIWQVVCLGLFGYFLAEYTFRTHRHRDELTPESMTLFHSKKFRLFVGATMTAYVTILARCIYRIPELTGGWGNPLMRAEVEFIVLEGLMIVISVLVLTVFHPGYCFPALANTIGKSRRQKSRTSSDLDIDKMHIIY